LENPNDGASHNYEDFVGAEEMKKQKEGTLAEDILVKDIIGRKEAKGEEEEETEEEFAEENPVVGRKRKIPEALSRETSMEIMLPHIPYTLVVITDMLEKWRN
jgi:hypothetical protein